MFVLQESELERISRAREAELKYVRDQNEVEISKAREMADIETGKFENTVKAIGADTLRAIAVSGPEMQVKMLKALGLQSTLITDGSSPINLFNTAQGLIGGMGAPGAGGDASALMSRRQRVVEEDEASEA